MVKSLLITSCIFTIIIPPTYCSTLSLIVKLPHIQVLKASINVRDAPVSLSDSREDTCETNLNQYLKKISVLGRVRVLWH